MAFEKHKTEHVKCDGNGEFVGSVSSGLCAVTGQIKRSKNGAGMSLLPFKSAPSSEAVPGLALGMAGEHTQQCWILRLSVLSCSLALSCLAEYLY